MLLSGRKNNRSQVKSEAVTGTADLSGFLSGLIEDGGCLATAERLSPVAAAHRIYTNSLAVMPWQIRQKKGEIRDEVGHYLEPILKNRSNEQMSAYMARKVMLSQAFWFGAGYMYIERGRDGKVISLIPLPSEGVQRSVDTQTGTVWYAFTVSTDDPERPKLMRKFSRSELLIHYFETYDGRTGRGFLELARDVVGADSAAQKYQKKFYLQGAQPSGIIQTEATLDSEAASIVRDDFENMASGMDNAFRVAILDNGLKFQQLGISQKDAQYIEGRAFTIEEVCRITGIPAYMLQTGKQSYQSNAQQQLDFVTNTLMAPIVAMEQEWGWQLFSQKERASGFYLHLNMAALLRADDEARSRFYEKMIGLGIYNQDECRALEDRSPLPGGLGQNYWMSQNYMKIEDFGKEFVENGN